jgi:glutathione S-transferase
MVRIWGRINSINVRKAVWAARETGVAFERFDAGREFGVVKTPEYLRKNPNALIPLLEDGDVLLWESNVIVRYLAARYAPGHLYPEPLAARFDAERWMDWQQTTLNPATRGAFMQLIRTPADERDAGLIANSNAASEPLMAILDEHLSTRRYLLGDAFTMADIPIGCEVHRWFGLPQPRSSHPHLERWYAQVSARPAAATVLTWPLT